MQYLLLYQYTAHWLLLCQGIMMLLSYTIVDFHLFYDGAVDIQIWAPPTRSQCKVCDTQVTVKACGPHFKNIQGKNNLCFVADNCIQFPIILAFWSFAAGLRLGYYVKHSYTIVDFHLFYDGAVDIQIRALLTRSQCKVSDTQVSVKAHGPLV